MFHLGWYFYGNDGAQAIAWWRKAAEQGYREAQCRLGLCYDRGKIVAQNEIEAAAWFHKAAEQGHSIAQKKLGDYYQSGKGVKQDLVEAYKWFLITENTPDVETRNNLLKTLSVAQISAGQRRAVEFVAKYFPHETGRLECKLKHFADP